MGWTCGTYGGEKRCIQCLVGKPEGRRPLEGLTPRQEDNIKMNLWEVGWGRIDYTDLAEDRDRWWAFVNAIMNLRIPLNAGNFLSSCWSVSYSGTTLLHGVSSRYSVGHQSLRSWSKWVLVFPTGKPLRHGVQCRRFVELLCLLYERAVPRSHKWVKARTHFYFPMRIDKSVTFVTSDTDDGVRENLRNVGFFLYWRCW